MWAAALLLAMLPLLSMSQQTGKLRLFVDPGHSFLVRAGSGAPQSTRMLELPVGPQRLRLWAPGYQVLDTTANVLPDLTTDLTARLRMSAEYAAHKREVMRFERKRRTARTIPMIATIGSTLWTLTAMKKQNDAHDELKDLEAEYDRLAHAGRIADLKEKAIPDAKQAFASARNNLILASSLTAVSLGTTVFMFMRTAKWQRPQYDDKQRVIFEGLAMLPADQGMMFHLNLAIR